VRRSRYEELVRAADYHGEGSARLYLAGEYANALIGCGHSVDALEALHRNDRSDRRIVDVLADRLRDRAEIRREVGRTSADPAEAAEQYRLGIADTTRAIALRESLGPPEYPLWVPNVRLQRAEFHAHLGAAEPARADAAAAVAGHREHRTAGDEDTETLMAVALARQAEVLALIGSPALEARREAVTLYRAYDSQGLRTRHQHGLIWSSTPTWPRYCATAVDLARDLGPPNADHAPEALLALQDAAEGFADPSTGPDRWATYRTLRQQVRWLGELGADALAAAYLAVAAAGAHVDPADVRALRPGLDRLLAAT